MWASRNADGKTGVATDVLSSIGQFPGAPTQMTTNRCPTTPKVCSLGSAGAAPSLQQEGRFQQERVGSRREVGAAVAAGQGEVKGAEGQVQEPRDGRTRGRSPTKGRNGRERNTGRLGTTHCEGANSFLACATFQRFSSPRWQKYGRPRRKPSQSSKALCSGLGSPHVAWLMARASGVP